MRALAIFLAGGAVACGGADSPPPTLVFWALGREGEVVERLLPGFAQENPGLSVRVQQIPFTAAHEKLLTAYVGRSTPDVAQVGNTWIAELVALDALEPLDPWLAHQPSLRAEDHFPGIWATNVVRGRLWGIPWYVDTRVLFYRRDLVARAGFSHMPKDWAGLRQLAEELIKRKLAPYAFYLPTDEWVFLVLLAMQAGSVLVDEQLEPQFCQPAFLQALGFYADLFRQRLAPVMGNAQMGNYYQRFADGFFALYVTGPWNLGEFRRRLPEALQESWHTVPLPAPAAQDFPGVSLAGGSSLVVFRRSPHKEQALRLLAYLNRPQVQVAFYQLVGDLPANRRAWEDPLLAQDPRLAAFRLQLTRVQPLPQLPEVEQLMQRLWEVVEPALRGQATLAEVCGHMDEEARRILAKRRWLRQRGKL
ncbi:MAG: extracellular solute-binding protein [Thermoanaerobaculum sp.]|nr:extracellular solute-binding protein [Thermoanaerobaculum sp.]MDW7968748.1 extracellular solute-binding protein [Thermoanaerobaculum sp.]